MLFSLGFLHLVSHILNVNLNRRRNLKKIDIDLLRQREPNASSVVRSALVYAIQHAAMEPWKSTNSFVRGYKDTRVRRDDILKEVIQYLSSFAIIVY